jgi:hypothetical protein
VERSIVEIHPFAETKGSKPERSVSRYFSETALYDGQSLSWIISIALQLVGFEIKWPIPRHVVH